MELSTDLCILGYVAIMFQIISLIIGSIVLNLMFGALGIVSFISAIKFINRGD